MNKNLTISGGIFFIFELLVLFVYLVSTRVSLETVEVVAPWIMVGAVNIAFLIILLVGLCSRE